MATQPVPRLSEEEYLRIERAATFKSEYVGGEMFAMPGGTPKHSMLAARVIIELGSQLRGKHCRVLTSDMRLRTPGTGANLYPDVSVACGPVQLYPGSTDLMVNPALIVEVQSPSTADYDRRTKFQLYCEFPTFFDYIIIHQDSIHVEHYSRQTDGSWVLTEHKCEEARILLPRIECALHAGSIYEGVMGDPS